MSENIASPELQIATVEELIKETPEIAGLQAYEYLRSNAESQRAGFIDGTISHLDLTYARLTEDSLAKIAEPAQAALEAMLPLTDDRKSDSLFESVAYRMAEMSMLSAARKMNDPTLSELERKEAQDWFVLISESVHGAPDKEVFSALAGKYIGSQLEKSYSDAPVAAQISQELGGLLGELSDTDYELFAPKQETIDRINGLVTERFEHQVEHIDVEKMYDVDEALDALTLALEKMDGVAQGWNAEKVPDSSTFATSAHRRMIEVGEDVDPVTGEYMRGLVIHEEGVHAKRSMNAERAGWVSAQYGADGYLDFEESLATALADAYLGEYKEKGAISYIVAGLAYGLDNHAPRDFRDVYEVVWRHSALKKYGTDDLTEEQIQASKHTAFTSCLRLFRGTSTRNPGVVYLKDLSYHNGQAAAWSILENVHTQDDFDLLQAGKLDLTRPEHSEIAKDIVATNKRQ